MTNLSIVVKFKLEDDVRTGLKYSLGKRYSEFSKTEKGNL